MLDLRIQFGFVLAVSYTDHQGIIWCFLNHREVDLLLTWVGVPVPALTTMLIPDLETWQADFLNHQCLDCWEWSLSEVFSTSFVGEGCWISWIPGWTIKWIVLPPDQLISHPLQWDYFNLIYAFPPLILLPWLFCRILSEGMQWFSWLWTGPALSGNCGDAPRVLPDRLDLLLPFGLFYHPVSQSLATAAQVMRDRSLWDS